MDLENPPKSIPPWGLALIKAAARTYVGITYTAPRLIAGNLTLAFLRIERIFLKIELAYLQAVMSRLRGVPSVRFIVALIDLVPSARIRKRTKKMVADEESHMAYLGKAGRFKAARWIWWCTLGRTLWMMAEGLIGGLIRPVTKAIKALLP